MYSKGEGNWEAGSTTMGPLASAPNETLPSCCGGWADDRADEGTLLFNRFIVIGVDNHFTEAWWMT